MSKQKGSVTSVDVIFPLFARQVAAILGNKNLQTLLLDAGGLL